MDIKNILIPTDFSACSGNALYYTAHLASVLHADLILLHSYDFSDEYSAVPAEQIISMKNSVKKDAEEHMQKFIKDTALSPDIHLSYDLELGFFIEHLSHVVKKKKIDLLSMGTKGSQGLESVLFGTYASQVIDVATCPLLVIPDEAVYSPIKNILFLSRYQKADIVRLKYVAEIAKKLDATIFVVNVTGESHPSPDNNFIKMVSEEIDYSSISFRCIKGDKILNCINKFAEDENMDWIVMHVAHRNAFVRALGPNLTKEVSYHTKIPLFVFPEKMVIV